jgi:hypothetical protein
MYGLTGTPLTDFDQEAHHGNPRPHAHNWDGYGRDEGGAGLLLPWPIDMTEEILKTWGYFHDWYLDSVTIGPNAEPRALTLGLHLDTRHAVVRFNGVTCVSVEHLGLLNIVYGIHIVAPDDAKYRRARAVLEAGERLTDRKAALLAFLYSTVGAELAIECDSLDVHATEGGTSGPPFL